LNHDEIVIQLSQRIPSDVVYAITMHSTLTAIVQRMGEDALTLSADDLHLAVDEVKEAICHNLDERDYIDMGLDAWEITRQL